MRAGDEIRAVNGERMIFMRQAAEALRRSGGRPVDLHLRRNGQDLHLEVMPESREGYPVWIGITMREATKSFDPGPLEAIQLSVERNIEFSGLIFRTLGGLFIGETSVRQLQALWRSRSCRRVGAGRWIASSPMVDQPQPRPVEPIRSPYSMAVTSSHAPKNARRDFTWRSKRRCCSRIRPLMMLMVTVIYNDLMRIPLIQNLIPWRN